MGSTIVALVVLGFARHYWLLLVGSALIGSGSAVFHPESSRVARLAWGGRYGFAQSTFQLGGKFGVDVQTSQLMLFVFLGTSAAEVFLGGPIGDRYGPKFVIWLSIIGALPFALARPYANFAWTIILLVIIGIVFSSCFSDIVVFA